MINGRWYIENKLNILLPRELEVHHIDKNRNNNTLENFIILERKWHRRLHSEMKSNNMIYSRKEVLDFLRENGVFCKVFLHR